MISRVSVPVPLNMNTVDLKCPMSVWLYHAHGEKLL